MKKEAGNIGEYITACIGILFMSILLFQYLDRVELLNQKEDVNQVVRKYILKMETCGQLTDADRLALCSELEQIGVTETNLSGSSFDRVGYGETIELHVQGKLRGEYDFEESRVSTAKY